MTADKKARPSSAQGEQAAILPPGTRGFTLIELILVIAIVGLLIALLTPSLQGVYTKAQRTRTLAYLGQTARILHTYSNDWNECWPWFADPKATVTYIRNPARGEVYEMPAYFMSCMFWPRALADSYFDGDPAPRYVFDAEQVAKYGVGGSPFELSCTVFTDPGFWHPLTRVGREQYRAVRQSETVFPSSKVLLLSLYQPNEIGLLTETSRFNVPFARMDGSAASRRSDAFIPGYKSGEAPAPGWVHPFDIGGGQHTIDGVKGRDM